jgi:nucleoside-diphosphate-sugar epimerase
MNNKPLLKSDLEEVFTNSRNNFKKLQGKVLFISGGTGFFGKWIIESINYANMKLETPIKIISVSRNPELFFKTYPHFKIFKNFQLLKGDLSTDFPILDQIDYLIHSAADVRTSLHESQRELFLQQEELIVENIKKLSQEHSILRLLFTSSGAVYGNLSNNSALPKEDTTNSSELSAYGEAKVKAELSISQFCKDNDIPYNLARCFAFIGPYLPLDKSYAAGNFFLDSISNRQIIIKGDGSPQRGYLYMSDLVSALLALLMHKETNTIFNIGSSELISIKELAEKVSALYSTKPVKVLQTQREDQNINCYAPNIQKATSELAWSPKVTLDESLVRFKNWLSQN